MESGPSSAELEGALVVDFPLRGEWMAVHTPGSRIPSHGTDMLGQRYAFDLIRFDPRKEGRYHPAGGLRTLLLGVPTRECHGWGEEIHAPLDGAVVAARDDLPERSRIHPVREVALALKNGLTFRPTPQHLHRVLGNHVILRCGDVWAGFAHLTTGSVAVKIGQEVHVGHVLGRVGHTGNSTAPHLHFQLMDGPNPLVAKGVPCAFRAYEVRRDDAWHRVENAIPASTERIRSVQQTSPQPNRLLDPSTTGLHVRT
jgi:murein DD-endopeptidase MepM/ murein hydrolase activator NlpD